MNKVAIGIDIGGTSTKIGVVSPDGRILDQLAFPTWQTKNENSFYNIIQESIEDLCEGKYEIVGVGIGAPSTNMSEGTIENAANLPFKGIVKIVKNLSTILKRDVYLVKDSFAAAYGEIYYGAAKNLDNFIFLTLGTGFGCAVFANGKPLTGMKGLAGEVGHTRVAHHEPRQCACGKEGCLETYVSATGLRRTALVLMGTHVIDSQMRGITADKLTSKKIYELAKEGDILANEVYQYTARILGEKMSDLAATFSPQAIFLSGGLTGASEYILDEAIVAMNKHLLPFYRGLFEVKFSALGINDAALLGAASLVWKGKEAEDKEINRLLESLKVM